jgi:hypothetical protein
MYCLRCGKKIVGASFSAGNCKDCSNETASVVKSTFIKTRNSNPISFTIEDSDEGEDSGKSFDFSSFAIEVSDTSSEGKKIKMNDILEGGYSGGSYARTKNSGYTLQDFRSESKKVNKDSIDE